jgi:hypothetical protein
VIKCFCYVKGEDTSHIQWTDPEGNLITHRPPLLPPPEAPSYDLEESAQLMMGHVGRSRRGHNALPRLLPTAAAAPAGSSLLLSSLSWADMGLYTCTYTRGSAASAHSLRTFLYPLMPDLAEEDDDSSPAGGASFAVDRLIQLPILTE